jgi:hypothetical protein
VPLEPGFEVYDGGGGEDYSLVVIRNGVRRDLSRMGRAPGWVR